MKFPEQYRKSLKGWESEAGDPFGWFITSGPCGRQLAMLATDGEGTDWEHVSVTLKDKRKIPNWEEMCFVKNLFWESTECIVQFHPPSAEYVNIHHGCLHLWRYKKAAFPIPETILV